MLPRILAATTAVLVLGVPRSVAAQTMVTIEAPVNLTKLSPDLEKVRLQCGLGSDAIAPNTAFASALAKGVQDELPVMAGQLVTTMRAVFPIPEGVLQDPIGKTAEYMCGILGFSKSLQRWDQFSETSTVPAFQLKPTPAVIQGTFVW